jgi:hypothetical protein
LGKIGNRASAEFAIALYHPEYPAAVAPTIAMTVPAFSAVSRRGSSAGKGDLAFALALGLVLILISVGVSTTAFLLAGLGRERAGLGTGF